MKSLFKTVILIVMFTGITRLLGFLFRIWLSRTIGAEALGVYQISFSVFMVLLTLVCSGIPLVVSRLTAKHIAKSDKIAERSTVTSAVLISLTYSIVISILVLIFYKPLSNLFVDQRCIYLLLALLPALVFSSIYSAVRGNLWGKNNYVATCSAELFEQVARIIFCYILLCGIFPGISGDMGAAISMSIACICSCIFVVIWYFKIGGKFVKPKYIKEIAKTSAPITLMRTASSLISPVVALIIPLRLMAVGYTNTQALSLYGIASGMTMPLLFIPLTLIGSLAYAIVPDLATAKAKQDFEYINSRVNSSIAISLFIGFLILPLFVGAGENIGIFFFNNIQSGVLLAKSAWVVVPMCLTNITSSILNAVGLELKSFKNYILGAILMIVCVWFLPQFIGIDALIYALGLCFLSSGLLNLLMIKKHVCKINLFKFTLKLLTISIPCLALVSFMSGMFNTLIPLFFNLVISCSFGIIMFILLCLVFNVFKIDAVIVWLKSVKIFKVKKKKGRLIAKK